MKKVVRTSLNNVANKRGVRDLNIQLYSYDKNNAGFEFVIKNEVDLSEYKAKVLFDFQESFATWETKGTIEGNIVKVKFDTTFITKCEEVIGYLFLDSETDTLDVFKFKFNVVLSEIDKYDTAKRGFRYIKDQEVVDVITRSELREELSKIQVTGGVDLNGYLTTSVANETFATKQELGSYATKEELPSISGLVTTEQLTEAKNSVVEEINNKGYVTSTVAEETYAKKSDLPTPYNDSELVQKIGQLEARVDKDTVYDDTNVKERLTTLENKPPVDLSNYATKQELANVSGSQLSVDTLNLVTRQELEDKHYATEQSLNNYALKSELPQPYNDSALVQKIGQLEARVDNDTVYDDTALKERVTALESKAIAGGVYDDTHLRERLDTLEAKQDKDTVYDDTNIKERLTNLENKPSVDTSNFVTNTTLEEKHYVTNEQISSIYATKSEIPEPYSDIELVKRITVLENRQDNDTVYDDAELKRRVTALEEKPNVDTSNFVTTAVLESKGYLTTHQDISNLVTKQELQEATEIDYSNIVTTEELEPYAKKSELPEPYNDSALVSRVNALESKQATVYNDAEVKQRLTALENRPSTGGGTQDTGWIIISDDNPLHGNVVKIRRINDMVHVSLSNPNSEGLQLQFDDTVFRVILANKEIGKGFTPLNKLAIPVTEIESVMQTTTAETDVIGQVIFKVENGKAMMNGFGYKFSTSEPKEVHVNDFSYFTEDPFPTNLH